MGKSWVVEKGLRIGKFLVNNFVFPFGIPQFLWIVSTAAFGIIHRLILFSFLPMLGFYFCLQPIVGYNYGAKQFSQVGEYDFGFYGIRAGCGYTS